MAETPKTDEVVTKLVARMTELDAAGEGDERDSELLDDMVFRKFMEDAAEVCSQGHEAKVRFLLTERHMDEDQVLAYINGRSVLRINF